MTKKRFRKLLRAVFTEYYRANYYDGLGKVYRSIRNANAGDRQACYEAIKNALQTKAEEP